MKFLLFTSLCKCTEEIKRQGYTRILLVVCRLKVIQFQPYGQNSSSRTYPSVSRLCILTFFKTFRPTLHSHATEVRTRAQR
jgi:hypothetical protein